MSSVHLLIHYKDPHLKSELFTITVLISLTIIKVTANIRLIKCKTQDLNKIRVGFYILLVIDLKVESALIRVKYGLVLLDRGVLLRLPSCTSLMDSWVSTYAPNCELLKTISSHFTGLIRELDNFSASI